MTKLKTGDDKIVYVEKPAYALSPLENAFLVNAKNRQDRFTKTGAIVPIDLEKATHEELSYAWEAIVDKEVKQPLDNKEENLQDEISEKKILAPLILLGGTSVFSTLGYSTLQNTKITTLSKTANRSEKTDYYTMNAVSYVLSGVSFAMVALSIIGGRKLWQRITSAKQDLTATQTENKTRKFLQQEFIFDALNNPPSSNNNLEFTLDS